jgi:hypothetical protein
VIAKKKRAASGDWGGAKTSHGSALDSRAAPILIVSPGPSAKFRQKSLRVHSLGKINSYPSSRFFFFFFLFFFLA